MRQRNAVLVALGSLTVLVALAAILGRRPAPSRDERVSTLVAEPGGARALLEGLVRLGMPVQRFRSRTRELTGLELPPRSALAVLAPTAPFSPPERAALLATGARADLVLAGRQAEPLFRCFGYRIHRRVLDSARVRAPDGPLPADAPWVRAYLVATGIRTVTDSSRTFDASRVSCSVPPVAATDTLLVSEAGRPVALRLTRADNGREVVLVADEELFRNRALRRTAAGPFALGLFAGKYDKVVFEEYHHGFGASGSLTAVTLAWSRRSPWGWMVWQLAVVGLLALLFGAIRFGPAEAGIVRERRSPLEHLRALAAALAAARGHDVAIGAIVRGLRRRLVPPGLRLRGDWKAWLGRFERTTTSPRSREALSTLEVLTWPGQPPESVLRAANAVEDLWQDLKP